MYSPVPLGQVLSAALFSMTGILSSAGNCVFARESVTVTVPSSLSLTSLTALRRPEYRGDAAAVWMV